MISTVPNGHGHSGTMFYLSVIQVVQLSAELEQVAHLDIHSQHSATKSRAKYLTGHGQAPVGVLMSAQEVQLSGEPSQVKHL
jgi:hypothetical protein